MAIDLSGWDPLEHPRDRRGRFRDKWKLPEAAKRALQRLMHGFSPVTFRSDNHAQAFLDERARRSRHSKRQRASLDYYLTPARGDADAGWTDINSTLRAGTGREGELPQIRDIDSMMQPSDQDMILSRVVGPEAFGLTPETIHGVEEWTGKLVSDKAYQSMNLGSPYEVQGPHITLAVLAPRGTRMVIPGGHDRTVIVDRDAPLRISHITEDGRGGYYVYAAAMPRGDQREPSRSLGRELEPREISPITPATSEEIQRRGVPETQPEPNLTPEQQRQVISSERAAPTRERPGLIHQSDRAQQEHEARQRFRPSNPERGFPTAERLNREEAERPQADREAEQRDQERDALTRRLDDMERREQIRRLDDLERRMDRRFGPAEERAREQRSAERENRPEKPPSRTPRPVTKPVSEEKAAKRRTARQTPGAPSTRRGEKPSPETREEQRLARQRRGASVRAGRRRSARERERLENARQIEFREGENRLRGRVINEREGRGTVLWENGQREQNVDLNNPNIREIAPAKKAAKKAAPARNAVAPTRPRSARAQRDEETLAGIRRSTEMLRNEEGGPSTVDVRHPEGIWISETDIPVSRAVLRRMVRDGLLEEDERLGPRNRPHWYFKIPEGEVPERRTRGTRAPRRAPAMATPGKPRRFEDMRVPELREEMRRRGLPANSRTRRPDLIRMLNEDEKGGGRRGVPDVVSGPDETGRLAPTRGEGEPASPEAVRIARQLQDGEITPQQAADRLTGQPNADTPEARRERIRALRQRAVDDLRSQGFENPRQEMVEEHMRSLREQDERELIRSRSGGGRTTPAKKAVKAAKKAVPAAPRTRDDIMNDTSLNTYQRRTQLRRLGVPQNEIDRLSPTEVQQRRAIREAQRAERAQVAEDARRAAAAAAAQRHLPQRPTGDVVGTRTIALRNDHQHELYDQIRAEANSHNWSAIDSILQDRDLNYDYDLRRLARALDVPIDTRITNVAVMRRAIREDLQNRMNPRRTYEGIRIGELRADAGRRGIHIPARTNRDGLVDLLQRSDQGRLLPQDRDIRYWRDQDRRFARRQAEIDRANQRMAAQRAATAARQAAADAARAEAERRNHPDGLGRMDDTNEVRQLAREWGIEDADNLDRDGLIERLREAGAVAPHVSSQRLSRAQLERLTDAQLKTIASQRNVDLSQVSGRRETIGALASQYSTDSAPDMSTFHQELQSLPHNEQIRRIGEIFNQQYAGLNVEIEDISVHQTEMTFSARVYDQNHQPVGSITRTFHLPGGRSRTGFVYNAYLQLSRNVQGSGFAEEWNNNIFAWARRSGIPEVRVHANIDVGGYAWATKGFDFESSSDARIFIDRLRGAASNWRGGAHFPEVTFDHYFGHGSYRRFHNGTPTEQAAERARIDGIITEIDDIVSRADNSRFGSANYPSALEISQLGRQPNAGRDDRWIGKSIMLGSSWHGVLKL